MGRTTIEWTRGADGAPGRTWNPVTGCTKLSPASPGCENCYAETIAERFRGELAFPNGFDVQLREHKLPEPLRWQKPAKVFVNSMSDLFHQDVPDEYIARVFAVMALASQHTFQVLTKRHGRMRALLSDPEFIADVMTLCDCFDVTIEGVADAQRAVGHWPLPNVWLGVSTENQQWADIRIPALLDTPAAIRFISAEPLLRPVALCRCDGGVFEVQAHPFLIHPECPLHGRVHLDWCIVGGESGPKARPMHPAWARSLRDQCVAASVPIHFKQWGEFTPVIPDEPDWRKATDYLVSSVDGGAVQIADITHTDALASTTWSTMRRVGKGRAGRVLDARTWDQYPDGGV